MKHSPPRLHIEVDHDRCAGNAMCLDFAPGVFVLGPRRRAEVVDPEGDALEDILVAAENCPTAAITVSDAATGEPYEV
ncbi:MAG: ferredoxin [Gemmatimonadota bacterium]|nr:ferredoxin [Gemmatimonadota bacterium]